MTCGIRYHKIALCIFGVIPRSIKYVYPNMKENLINPLLKNFKVDIYVFNINVGKNLVDNTALNQEDCKIIEFDIFEEKKQVEIDKEVKKDYKGMDKIISDEGLDSRVVINSMRCMYGEWSVSEFLSKHRKKYVGALITSSDFWFLHKFKTHELFGSLFEKNTIYTSGIADSCGYTDGFMFGSIEPMIAVLSRYKYLKLFLPTKTNFEGILKLAFEKKKIRRKISKIAFFKVRANKNIFISPHKEFRILYNDEFVDKKHRELIEFMKSKTF